MSASRKFEVTYEFCSDCGAKHRVTTDSARIIPCTVCSHPIRTRA